MPLRELKITTTMGAEYRFPDVSLEDPTVEKMLRRPSGHDIVALNVSGAVLTIPLRIVATVHLGDELLWTRSA